jgi:cation diffusion facilitator CzcD-associated flavoprotein CzcO
MNLPVCIIGAGPSGLAAAKAFKKHNISFFIVEKHANAGGIWDIENPGSPMYEAAHFISSKTLSGFPGHPMPEHYPDYPGREQILAYIQSFAIKEGLVEHIHFNTKVTKVNKLADDEWEIQSDKKTYLASAVVCACGPLWTPNIPQFEGVFSGQIRHSNTFKKSEEFRDKRVLIVGGGNSGVDIACEAAIYAKEAHLSMRRGYRFIPKHIFGVPSDVFSHGGPKLPMWIQQPVFSFLLKLVVGDQTKYGLPKPDHKLLESHPLMNTQVIHHVTHGNLKVHKDIKNVEDKTVRFADNTEIEVDEIILATGFNFDIPFARQYFDWKNERPVTYLNVFNPKQDGIFVTGFVETNSAAYSLFSDLGELIALYLNAPDVVKSKYRSKIETEQLDLTNGLKLIDTPRHTGYLELDAAEREIKKAKKFFGI